MVAAKLAAFQASYPGFAGNLMSLEQAIGNGLANSGDQVTLLNGSGLLIDTMSYGSNTTAFNPACPAIPEGQSLARAPSDRDTDTRGDWSPQVTPNPGAAGVTAPSPTATASTAATTTASPVPTTTPAPTLTATLPPSPTASVTASMTPTATPVETATATATSTSTAAATRRPPPPRCPASPIHRCRLRDHARHPA